MQKQYELTEEKMMAIAGLFVENNGFPFEEIVGIIFEIPVNPYFFDDPDDYPEETRRDIIRLRRLTGWILDTVKTGAPGFERMLEIQAKTPDINNELADLLINDNQLSEFSKPYIVEFKDLIEKLKERGLK